MGSGSEREGAVNEKVRAQPFVPEAEEASPVTTPAWSRAMSRSALPSAAVMHLAAHAGNRVAARAVQRSGSGVHRRTDEELNARADAASSPANDRDRFSRGITDRDPGPLKQVVSWAAFNEAEKMQALGVLTNQGWAGPQDETAMEAIWSSFGGGVPQAAARNIGMWDACIARGAELADLPAVAAFRSTFESDVKAVARGYMARNLASIHGEIENIGAESTAPTADQQRERDDRLQFIQDLLKDVDKAKEAADALGRIPVGYNERTVKSGTQLHDVRTRVLFRPESAPDEGANEPGFASWADVKQHWDRIQAVITAYSGLSPAVHTALREGNTAQIANASPEEARRLISEQLRTTETKITETQPKIDSGDLDWRDLQPIHDQLYRGQGAPSGTNWSDRFYQSIAKDVIGDHEGMATLLAVGGGLLAGALFVVSEVASGGLATFCLIGAVGVGAGQAAASWEQWQDLNTAAQSSTSPDTELVSKGQADAALITAMVDTVFAFIDLFPAAKGVGNIWKARALTNAVNEARGLEALAKIARGGAGLTPEAISGALTRGVQELGVPETLRRAGKTADELVAIVGRESDAGKQVLEYQRLLAGAAEGGTRAVRTTAVEQAARIAKGELTGVAAEAAAREALTVLGPTELIKQSGGWVKLSSVLGNESAVGAELVRWRRAMYDDLIRWSEAGGLSRDGLADGQKVIEATGSSGAFKNDLDISTHGTRAAENRDLARRYLAQRAGCSPTELFNVLKNDFFTSAARMHAYDAVPEAVRDSIRTRQAALQQQLVMNAQLQAAVRDADDALAVQLRAQMASAGIPERPVTLLTRSQAETLSREVDGLQQQLIDAVAAGDVVAQERAASRIVENQAMVNVAEEGGYFTSGGTRRFVTERAEREAANSTSAALPAAERMSAVVDQIPKIEHAVHELRSANAAGDLGDIAEAIRSIGKYGKRMSEVGFSGAPDKAFADLAEKFGSLKARADRGVSRSAVEETVREAEGLLAQVQSQSHSLLTQLRNEAALNHGVASIETLSKAMAIHAKYLSFAAGLRRAMRVSVMAAPGVSHLATVPSSSSSAEPNQSTPPPEQ